MTMPKRTFCFGWLVVFVFKFELELILVLGDVAGKVLDGAQRTVCWISTLKYRGSTPGKEHDARCFPILQGTVSMLLDGYQSLTLIILVRQIYHALSTGLSWSSSSRDWCIRYQNSCMYLHSIGSFQFWRELGISHPKAIWAIWEFWAGILWPYSIGFPQVPVEWDAKKKNGAILIWPHQVPSAYRQHGWSHCGVS